MKLKHLLGHALLAASMIVVATETAHASVTSTVADGIRGTQQGRISRNGIPQTWDQDEAFGGVINPGITYYYSTYAITPGALNYLDFNFDASANTFLAIYQDRFDPTNLALNWLGDPGTSGDYFGTDVLFADVVAAVNRTVIAVVYNTGVNGGGINDPFTLRVSGFPDSSFDTAAVELQPVRVPEPSTVLLLLAPLALYGARRAMKRGAAANDGMVLAA